MNDIVSRPSQVSSENQCENVADTMFEMREQEFARAAGLYGDRVMQVE